jgi:transcriptional regulator with XRE-family HTH domain
MNLLRRARFFSGVTLQALSKKTGVSVSRLSSYERGFAELSEREKRKITKILKGRKDEIFPGDPEGLGGDPSRTGFLSEPGMNQPAAR